MMKTSFRPGDLVIYRKTKHSTHPGPRADNVYPAVRGETYAYTVDKFWIVEEIQDDGTVVAVTRRGKKNFIRSDDPMLRRANLLQKLLYRSRFAQLPETATPQQEMSAG